MKKSEKKKVKKNWKKKLGEVATTRVSPATALRARALESFRIFYKI